MSAPNVRPVLRLVPNGLDERGRQRLTLIASPVEASDGFPLDEWPQRIRASIAPDGDRIDVYASDEKVPSLTPIGESRKAEILQPAVSNDLQGRLAGAWKALVPSGSPQLWVALLDAIHLSLASKSYENGIGQGSATPSPEQLEKAVGADGAYSPQPVNPGQPLTIKSVLSVRHGDLAMLLEFERAKRVDELVATGKRSTAPTPTETLNRSDDDATSSTANVSTKDIEDKKRAAKLDELAKALAQLQDQRGGTGTDACQPAPRPDLAAIDRASDASTKALASHTAGTWQQAQATPACGDGKDKNIDYLVQAYQGIVSSPAWARFFGFAFDLALPLPTKATRWLSVGKDFVTFQVRTKDEKGQEKLEPHRVNRAWSAIDDHGWPLASNGGPENGLFKMGIDCTNTEVLPRFDLVTLDVRQATEALVRPLNSNGAQIRGFQTAGMCLIDRRRADDVRAQISRTSKVALTAAQGTEPPTLLYAEDLVVGRRLDVGMWNGATFIWRALGKRKVTYGLRNEGKGGTDFDAIDSKVTDSILLSGDVRTLEEAMIQPSARLAPNPAGGDAGRDVFVDEAFTTWSGAPMGVTTTAKSEHLEGCATDQGLNVPFLQRQMLPEKKMANSEALAPPLRHGVGYRFGMRAVFLGGQSKSVADASEAYNADEQEYTYPRDALRGTTPVRRCQRHEAIGAPFVLLPKSVLKGNAAIEMDYENIQSVLLRSLPDGYAEPQNLPPKLVGRPYTRARERISAGQAIRVFVPPQVALDELLRSGQLDAQDRRGAVVQGGLLTTAFGVAKGENDRLGGFPIAAIDEQLAFGVEPTRRKQAQGWTRAPKKRDEPAIRGSAIFIPTERLADAEFERRPYYPDPYATTLVLRLRSSSGDYVGDALEVPVYGKTAIYPNAMPTVLVVRAPKGDEATGRLKLDAKTTTFDGETLGSGSQNVRSVTLVLAPGDDFSLEAFYRPEVAVLATHFALTETIAAYKLGKGQLKADDAGAPITHVTTGFFPVPSDAVLATQAKRLIDFGCGRVDGKGGPIDDLAGYVSMRVAHAVNRPLAPAMFQDPGALAIYRTAVEPSTIARSMIGGPDDVPRRQPFDSRDAFAELNRIEEVERGLSDTVDTQRYLLSGRIAFNRKTTSAIEIVANCVSPREVLIDDPSRRRPSKARVAGAWPQRTVVRDQFGKVIAPTRVPAKELDVYGFEAIDERTGAVTLQRSEVTLLRIDNIGPPGTGRLAKNNDDLAAERRPEDVIDIQLAHIAAQVGLPIKIENGDGILLSASQLHAFPDYKARKLQLSLRAISRFGTDFETAARWTGRDGTSEPVVRLRQPLAPTEQSLESHVAKPGTSTQSMSPPDAQRTVECWLPSSSRPAKCAAVAPMPVFRFVSEPHTSGMKTLTRRTGLRIYLERGWFSSGEGERLGVIMPVAQGDVCADNEFVPDELYGPIGPYVSRWGGDPIRMDYAPLKVRLKTSNFDGVAPGNKSQPYFKPPYQLVPCAAVPIKTAAAPGADETVTVMAVADLLTYEPRFDVDREQWFVDLDITAPETPNLFIRLGLVRYQEHTIHPDLCVSEPVVVWGQLLPERTFSAWVDEVPPVQKSQAQPSLNGGDGSGYSFVCKVSGLSYKGMRLPERPSEIGDPNPDRLNLAKVRFKLVHESVRDGVMRRIPMGYSEAYLKEGEIVDQRRVECSTPTRDITKSQCSVTFNLLQSDVDALGEGSIYVYAEEVETFMPATYPNEPAYVADIFDPNTFLESGSRFAARLDVEMPRKQ